MVSQNELNTLLHEELERAKRVGLELEWTDEWCYQCKGTSRYGYNKTIAHQTHEIYIAKAYLGASLEEIRTVIAHEVAHSVVGSKGHDKKWQDAIELMKSDYNYTNSDYHLNPHPYGNNRRSSEHTPLKREQTTRKYMVKCEKCGHKISRARLCSLIKNPQDFHHINCGGHFVRVR